MINIILSKTLGELALILTLLSSALTAQNVIVVENTTSTPAIAYVPILERVAFCESGNRHFDKNGEVLRGKKNPSDVGLYQINEYFHKDQAEKLGFDIYTEEGNKAYAEWLYEKEGLKPWQYSKECWGLFPNPDA